MQTRTGFHRELERLQDQVLIMGSMVEKQVERSITALRTLDQELAQRVINADQDVDRARFRIEDHVVRLMANQQPMASDLRVLVATLSIIVDMERMADHAAGIGKIVLMHEDQPLLKPLVDIPRMAEVARGMLHRALDAFVERDELAAERVIAEDDEVDQCYDQVYRELLTYMLNDPRTIDRATWLLWVAHNLERIADRATNIAERVSYLTTGRLPADPPTVPAAPLTSGA